MLVDTRICFTAKLLQLHHGLTVVHTGCVFCGTLVLNVSSKNCCLVLTAADCAFMDTCGACTLACDVCNDFVVATAVSNGANFLLS